MRIIMSLTLCLWTLDACSADTVLDLGTARLALQDNGLWADITFADGTHWPLIAWPGEAARRYGLPHSDDDSAVSTTLMQIALPAGEHTVRFGCAGDLLMPIRVRWTLQPAERHALP